MIKGISIGTLRGDLFGGITAGVVALPLALAFGVASGAGATAGLYGAIIVGLFAALLGGTRMQISGPTGPMTVVFAAVLVAVGGNIPMAMAAVFIGGVLQIVMGVLRAGGLVRFIPYPVISGFMSGIGIIIILLQIAPLIGSHPKSSPLTAVAAMPSIIMAFNWQAAVLGVLTLLIVFFTPMKISRVIPSPLIALISMTLLSLALKFQVPIIGEIPVGLPKLVIPAVSLETWTTILVLGITLALLGAIDSLLTSLVADSISNTRHEPNRELVGQGIGNMLCAFAGGLPGAGATMRTVVNIKAGGQTRVSGVTHALFLLALLLGAAPLASNIPMAVLAGILIKVGVDILDYRLLGLLKTAPRTDVAVMGVVFGLTVFVDLIVAVGTGVVLSMAMIIRRLTHEACCTIYPVGQSSAQNGSLADMKLHDGCVWTAPEDSEGSEGPHDTMSEGIRVLDFSGPFFFGSMSQMVERTDSVMGTRALIFDCRKVPFMDLTAIFALEDMVIRLNAIDIPVFVVLSPRHHNRLRTLNIPELPESILFVDFDEAEQKARSVPEKK